MPDEQIRRYNPIITGFSGSQGPLNISLTDAKQTFGELPSRYGFLSAKKGKTNQRRSEHKTLNLEIGHLIKTLLSDQKKSLKKIVYRFFNDWHRDLREEFQVDVDPFFNMNNALNLRKILADNRDDLIRFSTVDVKHLISGSRLIRRDVLNSIAPDILVEKCKEIISKKNKYLSSGSLQTAKDIVNTLHCHAITNRMKYFIGDDISAPETDTLDSFTDEISHLLLEYHQFRPLRHIGKISAMTGQGIEFEYASRDVSYLDLGKMTGDCTADKRNFQSDVTIENIFWTVFSWILDRNYQILKVFFNGEFVMKVHLLPLYVTEFNDYGIRHRACLSKSDYIVLAVDAIETTVAFRGHQTSSSDQNHLSEHKKKIFSETMEVILNLADDMNIHYIYAEKFSNTPWIREYLKTYPEIFLHVDNLLKLDQLEDVYCLAEEISNTIGYRPPKEVFMELQMKNTYLSPGYINKAPGVKSFALVRGDSLDGIPMKKIVGI
jgi:hypothetical protein